MRKCAIILTLILLSVTAQAQKRLVNTDKQGLALKGHDPVAFFTQGRPVLGDYRYESNYNGTRYRFASAENK
jgi:hypothetical protein